MSRKVLNITWKIVKTVMAVLTVLTILIIFIQALPKIMEWNIIQEYSYLPMIFLVVVLFWCIYLVKWIKTG